MTPSDSNLPDSNSPDAHGSDVRTSGVAAVSPWRSYSVWAAVLTFVVTRIYLYGFMIAGVSDVTVYFPYAVMGVDGEMLPYRDIKVEYPPVAYWTLCLPRALSDWRLSEAMLKRRAETWTETWDRLAAGEDPQFSADFRALVAERDALDETFNQHLNHYDWGFRALMLGADLIAFGLFGLMFARRFPGLTAWGLWTYIAVTVLLGYLLFDRLDIGLTMLFIVWAYCWLRADGRKSDERAAKRAKEGAPVAAGNYEWLWSAAGYAALGIGIGYKLIPLIVVPFALLADFVRVLPKSRDLRLLCGPAVLLITALGPFVYYYLLVGNDLGRMFAYHADRGLQIESSYATMLMLSEPWSQLVCYYDFGSWNLRGRWEPQLLKASTWLLLAVLAALGLRSLFVAWRGPTYDRTAAVRMGAVAVAAATFLAKVLSPQYLIWSVPLLLWGAAEYFSPRWFKVAAIGCVVMAACTSFLFPCHYVDHLIVPPYSAGLHPGEEPFLPLWSLIHTTDQPLVNSRLAPDGVPQTVLIVRNLIMGVLTGAVVVAALRRPGSKAT